MSACNELNERAKNEVKWNERRNVAQRMEREWNENVMKMRVKESEINAAMC